MQLSMEVWIVVLFGTPRSRQLEGETPLEKLAGKVQGQGGVWQDGGGGETPQGEGENTTR